MGLSILCQKCYIFGETNPNIVEDQSKPLHPYSTRNRVGRPRIYNDLDELAYECDRYFEWIKGEKGEQYEVNDEGMEVRVWIREPEPPTMTGLALFLGFTSRQSLHDYVDRKDEFSYIVRVALMRVENGYERRLSGMAPTGAIFALKNMKWKDKTEQEVTGNMGVVWNETKTYDNPNTGSPASPAHFPPNLLLKSTKDDSEPETDPGT